MIKDISLAEYYDIPINTFAELGILNPILNRNTNMFIDPILLKDSRYELFNKQAYNEYKKYFEDLFTIIKTYINLPYQIKEKSKTNIIRKLKAKEIPTLCLGYSVTGKTGNGIGNEGAKRILEKAEELFSLDINNPAIFSVVYLLTDKIGPDYISDMTAQIILPQIQEFTQEMAPLLGLELQKFGKYNLPKHPYLNGALLLLPEDIISPLPIDVDIEDVYNGYHPNEEIRDRVNEYIANIFRDYNEKRNKKDLRDNLTEYFTRNLDVLNDFTEYVSKRKAEPYNFDEDKKGYYFAQRFKNIFNFDEINVKNLSLIEIVDETIKRFKNKIDNDNDIKRNLLWCENRPRNEKAWQQAFHLTIFQKLEDANIDISPEAQTGSGPIDFKLSKGNDCRILIEIKLSKNNPLKGLELQLEKYKECVGNKKAYFICFNLEQDNQKYQKLVTDLNNKKIELNLNTEIIIIDGRINPSASNLTLNFDK